MSFYPYVLHEISVLIELTLGHLCYLLTDVPPQPNSPPGVVFRVDHGSRPLNARTDFLILILKSTFNNYDIITLIIIDQFSCFLVENRAC